MSHPEHFRESLPLFKQDSTLSTLIGQPEPELLALRDAEPPFVTDCEGDADSQASKLTQSNVRPVDGQGGQQVHSFNDSGEVGRFDSGKPRTVRALQAGDAGSNPAAELTSSASTNGKSPAVNCDVAHARKSDGPNSHQAAESVSLTNLGRTRDAILSILRRKGPMTDEAIAVIYGEIHALAPRTFPMASPSGLRSRRSELVGMGFVHEVGTGKTKSGRPCAIWALKERKA